MAMYTRVSSCVRIKLKESRDVPVHALVKSVPTSADVQIPDIYFLRVIVFPQIGKFLVFYW